MINIYVYVMDTMADWEIAYISSELNSKRFFKKNTKEVSFQTVSFSKEPIKSMGGFTVIPDCVVSDIKLEKTNTLILPGSNTWSEISNSDATTHKLLHQEILTKAIDLLNCGGNVCAICGATVALAQMGILDNRAHTSNGNGFLEMFCPSYKGTKYYIDSPSVTDDNLITASCTGSLLFAFQIIQKLDVFSKQTLDAWYNYFSTGKAEYFYSMMQSIK